MENVIKIMLDFGFNPVNAVIVYKIIDTIQMIIAFLMIGYGIKWIINKAKIN